MPADGGEPRYPATSLGLDDDDADDDDREAGGMASRHPGPAWHHRRMSGTEAWTTPEQIAAKTTEFEAAASAAFGYVRPFAFGICHDNVDGSVVVDRVNVPARLLPAAAMALVLGERWAPNCAVRISAAELDQARAIAGPAEACTDVPHPNLIAWRYLREEIGDHGTAVAVYLDRIDKTDTGDAYVDAVLGEIHRGRIENADGTTTLWRPVGPAELDLLRASGMTAWPPRLPDQPIFYPVLNQDYAEHIAREWNVAASGSGYVTRSNVLASFARRYPTQQAGGAGHLELWIPAEDVDELNRSIVGPIEIVGEHRGL